MFSFADIIIYGIFIYLMGPAGNYICKCILKWSGISQHAGSAAASDAEIRAGRTIGLLERALIFTGIIFGSWEVVVAVIALKTVARYKELDEKINAEYFLIGSMTSLLWAAFISIVILYYDSYYSSGSIKMLTQLVK